MPQHFLWVLSLMRCTCFWAAAWLRVTILEAAGAAVRLLVPLGWFSLATTAPEMSAIPL